MMNVYLLINAREGEEFIYTQKEHSLIQSGLNPTPSTPLWTTQLRRRRELYHICYRHSNAEVTLIHVVSVRSHQHLLKQHWRTEHDYLTRYNE